MTVFSIIGFGEVGGIFARDLVAGGASVRAFDVDAAAMARAEAAAGVVACGSAAAALAGADAAFVCVTAGSVLEAMSMVQAGVEAGVPGGLNHRPFVVDVNSVSPAVKQAAGAVVAQAGGRYVEAAVMASVPPKGLRTPMLLGGPDAAAFMELMAPFGMALQFYSEAIGKASSVKMCRSVMVKGLEALTTECMLAARHYGVEQDVLASLKDTLPHPDWPGLARYVISRSLIHGKRRAEEMREVARTVAEAGVEPLAARAITQRQDWAWRQGAAMPDEVLGTTELLVLLDGLREAMAKTG